EAAFRLVCALGLAPRLVEAGGALFHALLQGLVAALEFGFVATERGDVGERGDEAAAGHRIAPDLDDAAIGEYALADVGRTGQHVAHALGRFGTHARSDIT